MKCFYEGCQKSAEYWLEIELDDPLNDGSVTYCDVELCQEHYYEANQNRV